MNAERERGSGPAERAGGGRATVLSVAVLTGACACAFGTGIRGAFIYDDLDALVYNPSIRSLWPPGGALFPRPGLTISGRPLLSLSFALNYAVSGLNTWSYHIVNAGIHAGAALFLFGLIRRTLGLPGWSGSPVWPGWLARLGSGVRPRPRGTDATLFAAVSALVWAMHPLQTESVTYVVQRAESLAGLFILAALYFSVRSLGQDRPSAGDRPAGGGRRWTALAWAACLLGVATKEVAAVAPVLALLLDRCFVSGTLRESVRRHWRLHTGLFATWVPLLGLLATQGWNRHGAVGIGTGVSPWAYGLTQPVAIVHYLRLAVWPHPLVFDYGTFWIGSAAGCAPQALVVGVLLAVTVAALRACPAAGYLGAWFFLILAPTSLVPGVTQMIVEHRMYLPLAAVVVLVAWLGWSALGRPWLWALACAAAVLGGLTAARNEDYRSELVLWTKTAIQRPDNAEAQYGVGHALLLGGRVDEALVFLRRAAALNPSDASIHNNLGAALLKSGRLDEAIGQFAAEVRLKPRDAWTRNNFAIALFQAGRIREAADQYAVAVRLQPGSAHLHKDLAVMLDRLGRLDEAINEYAKSLQLDPSQGDVAKALANDRQTVGAVP